MGNWRVVLGDRIDAMMQLSNGDMLYAGSFCWVGAASQGCNLSNSGVQLDPIANDDAFILRVDSNGTWKWGQVLGGLSSWDIVTDLAEAPNGDIYLSFSIVIKTTATNVKLSQNYHIQTPQ